MNRTIVDEDVLKAPRKDCSPWPKMSDTAWQDKTFRQLNTSRENP